MARDVGFQRFIANKQVILPNNVHVLNKNAFFTQINFKRRFIHVHKNRTIVYWTLPFYTRFKFIFQEIVTIINEFIIQIYIWVDIMVKIQIIIFELNNSKFVCLVDRAPISQAN